MILPVDFVAQTRPLLGDEAFEQLALALKETPPVSIRLNPFKPINTVGSVADALYNRVPWCGEGYYLSERLTFTFDPLFHAGCYYVQEASSMFLEQVISQYISTSAIALDLCAAPGGKSTHLRSLLPADSLLVSNEVIRNRAQILAENQIKWGHPDVVVCNNDPADFSSYPSFFDMILADVPCSGEGMFRKDPEAINEWSLANVEICSQRQRRIVADVWPSLKPGGLLIYSTCTYNIKENEENIAWIRDELGAEVLPITVPQEWQVTGNLWHDDFPVYRFMPHKTKGEGFFLAVLQKTATDQSASTLYNKSKSKKGKVDFSQEWLLRQEDYQLSVAGTTLSAIRKNMEPAVDRLKQKLRVVHAGITLGEVKGKDIVPSHALAMSSELLQDNFRKHDVSYEQAISYLRKEALVLSADVPKGIVLLTYKNIPLGFAKNIGNRANNLYPQEWRIRSGYLPEEIKVL